MADYDDDLIIGRKAILTFLQLSDWGAVQRRIGKGLPVVKIAGRIEMSRKKYQIWRDKMPMVIPVNKTDPAEEGAQQGSLLAEVVREGARRLLQAAIRVEITASIAALSTPPELKTEVSTDED